VTPVISAEPKVKVSDNRPSRIELSRVIARAKQGDSGAIHWLYVNYSDNVYGYARSILRDEHEAEDIRQQVFVRLITSIGSYKERSVPFAAWLLRVTHNMAIDYLRRRRPILCEEARSPNVRAEERGRELSEALTTALSELPPIQRDVIVLRHDEEGAARRAAAVSDVPVINAGDGRGQHPTQALLDIYTIRAELGRVDGVEIAMVGDLANGRTVRSLTYLLSKYRDVRIWFVSPPQVAMRQDIKDHLDERRIEWAETADLESILGKVDVVYQTRIQKERFVDPADYQAVRGIYRITAATMERLGPQAVVMHPLPRVDEIAPEVDEDPRAAYFRQARNGLYIRMALLDMVLS